MSRFVVYVTGSDADVNLGEAVAKDMIKLRTLCANKGTDLLYLVDDSPPAVKAKEYAQSLNIDTRDLGHTDEKVIESGVKNSDTVLFYGDEDSDLFDLVMDYTYDDEKVKTRGRIQKKQSPVGFSEGDKYSQYHEMLDLHTHFKRQPYQGIRIFRQVDLRPPSWIGGVRRPPGYKG